MTPEEIAAAEAAQKAADAAKAQAAADAVKAEEEAKAKTEAKTYDEAYVKTLRAEAQSNRLKLAAFEKAETERKQAEMTEAEKLTARAEAAEKRAKELEIQHVRTKAAARYALPDDLHEFITAEDEPGALAQAEKLAAKLKPATGLPGAGGRQPANASDAGAKANEAERFGEMQSRVPSLRGRVVH